MIHERSKHFAAMKIFGKKRRGSKRSLSLAIDGARGSDFIPAAKLRAKLGISAVTLWRWRHNPDARFPAAKRINGRLYFPSVAVAAWLVEQPETT